MKAVISRFDCSKEMVIEEPFRISIVDEKGTIVEIVCNGECYVDRRVIEWKREYLKH